jgi:hypothetical protein
MGLGRMLLIGLGAWLISGMAGRLNAAGPDFLREVRPILSHACWRCHGFDAATRESGLRLDTREGATRVADSGRTAIVVGQPDASELMRRIMTTDASERMPPPGHGEPLTAVQIETLRRWIEAGAPFDAHWSFVPPRRAVLPPVQDRQWVRNRIDHLVLARLEQEQRHPNPSATPQRLLRRVSLALTGLPPTLEELRAYELACEVDAEAAYRAAVERLLASPHFGERLAIDWLDAARYADTNGYFGDRPREQWPWRDWVVRAFNANLPFDQFTIEQLAGDLLPEPTTDQLVATGFHRNSMANNETGIIDEEFRVEAVADRVETTATVWLGATLACAQCHDHKYDPFSQRDYYRFFAYFNNSVESGLVTRDDPPPTLEVATPEQQQRWQQRTAARQAAEAAFQACSTTLDADLAQWQVGALAELDEPLGDTWLAEGFHQGMPAAPWQVVGTTLETDRGIAGLAGQFDATRHLEAPADSFADPVDGPWTLAIWCRPSSSLGCLWSKIEPTGRRRGIELIWQKGRLQLNLVHHWGDRMLAVTTREPVTTGNWHQVVVTYDGSQRASGIRIYLDGQPAAVEVRADSLAGTLVCREPFRLGRRDAGLGFYGSLDEFRARSQVVTAEDVLHGFDQERLRGILTRPAADHQAADKQTLRDYYIRTQASAELRIAQQQLQQAQTAEREAREAIATTLIMREREEVRPTTILIRGQYDQPGERVEPGVPGLFPAPSDALPANRLGLARWLVSPDNPLTARVTVNRLWQLCFGDGLVRTANDLGVQGELPTHPELLDDLAVELLESGWNLKHLLRLIVTSATFRQASQPQAVSLADDPDNRWLARGPRYRLPAELIRDQALVISGLLSSQIGGPSVRPWQPPGLWEEVSYNAEDSYEPDQGASLWRRSLYTYWKRQAPPPTFLTFDANTREKCVVQRSRTNTPLQALVLLNEPTYLAAALELAKKTLRDLPVEAKSTASVRSTHSAQQQDGAANPNPSGIAAGLANTAAMPHPLAPPVAAERDVSLPVGGSPTAGSHAPVPNSLPPLRTTASSSVKRTGDQAENQAASPASNPPLNQIKMPLLRPSVGQARRTVEPRLEDRNPSPAAQHETTRVAVGDGEASQDSRGIPKDDSRPLSAAGREPGIVDAQTDRARLKTLFRRCCGRSAEPRELELLVNLLARQRLAVRTDSETARQFLHALAITFDSEPTGGEQAALGAESDMQHVAQQTGAGRSSGEATLKVSAGASGESTKGQRLAAQPAARTATQPASRPADRERPQPEQELVAWALVAHTLLNLDEVMTQR